MNLSPDGVADLLIYLLLKYDSAPLLVILFV